MSWSEPRASGRRRLCRALLVAAAGGVLAASCGFRPLYGKRSAERSSTVESLAEIYVQPVADRPGQQFTNLLRDRINPRGVPRNAKYQLEVVLEESTRELALRQDETATRADLRLTAEYALFQRASGAALLRGSSFSVNSYNILESQFATQVSEEDARTRGLREISDDIRTRLAVFFERGEDAT